jgi:hypothetical protein
VDDDEQLSITVHALSMLLRTMSRVLPVVHMHSTPCIPVPTT